MARSVKDAKLDSRTQRLKLRKGKRHWKAVSRGLALGYWRGTKSSSWLVRKALGGNKYTIYTLDGRPDDHEDSDGGAVLNFYEAQDQARAWVSAGRSKSGPYTVRQAVADYLRDFEGKSRTETELVINLHILPKLGGRKVAELTAPEIRRWQRSIQSAKPRVRGKDGAVQYRKGDIDERARKATANRVLTVLKAALNHAWFNGETPSNREWARVKPYRMATKVRVRYLSDDECRRLINACAPDFRPLVRAALYTGARYGELCSLKVHDYDSENGTVYIEPSKGAPRYTYLTDEGRRFFDSVARGRNAGNLPLFLRADGESWGKGHQKRRIGEASKAARIDPPVTFHVLRHTFGSQLARKGVPLQVIAEAMGHSNPKITHQYYAHLMPSYVEKTIRGALPDYGLDEDNVAAIGGKA